VAVLRPLGSTRITQTPTARGTELLVAHRSD
jgi:hypothetical protein